MWCKRCKEDVEPIVQIDFLPHYELDGNIYEQQEVCRCPVCYSVVEDAGRCTITGDPCDPDRNFSEEMYGLFGDYLEPALARIGELLEKQGYNFTRFKVAGLAEEWLEDYVG